MLTGTRAAEANTSGAMTGKGGRLRALGVPHRQTHGGKDPQQAEGEVQHQHYPGEERQGIGHHPEAHREAHGYDDPHHYHGAREIGRGTAGQHRGSRHGQRAEPLQQPALDVGGHADPRCHGTEDHRLDEDARHQVVDVGDARDVEIAPPKT